MRTKPHFISNYEFRNRISGGVLGAIVIFVMFWCFSLINNACEKDARQFWRDGNSWYEENNRAALFFRDGDAEGIAGLEDDWPGSNRRFLQFLWVLANNEPRQVREHYYENYAGEPADDGKVSLGTWRAIYNDPASARERLAFLKDGGLWRTTELDVAIAFVEGKEPSLRTLQPNPASYYQMVFWIGLLVAYAMVCAAMARSFAKGYSKDYGNSMFDLPRSVFPYTVMLLFAPAFAVPWALRGLYHGLYQLVVRPVRAVTRWVNRGAKTSEIYGQFVRLKTRKARQVRQELIVSGADVLATRAETAALAKAVECEADPVQREAMLAEFKQFNIWLDEIAEHRVSRGCVSIPDQMRWLKSRIIALHEAEFNRLR